MSIGNWDPKAEAEQNDYKIDTDKLQQFIALSRNEQLENLAQILSAEEQQQQSTLMQLPQKEWLASAEEFNDDELEQLIRFFTIAEKLPGWEAGANSPVIGLGKLLKKRGTGINRELILWIKAHSNNRFLPHGALL